MGAPSLEVHGSIQDKVGWGFEQPGLVGGVPAYGKGLELEGL